MSDKYASINKSDLEDSLSPPDAILRSQINRNGPLISGEMVLKSVAEAYQQPLGEHLPFHSSKGDQVHDVECGDGGDRATTIFGGHMNHIQARDWASASEAETIY